MKLKFRPNYGPSRMVVPPRYTTMSYLNTLEAGLLPIYDGELYMQDSAPIHKSRVSLQWFDDNSVSLLTGRPPYSPDLNPIEHLWPRLKELIYHLDPELDDITNKDRQYEALCRVLPRAFAQISKPIVDACLNSMRLRLQTVIDTQGWHTKY
jgi:transposase